MTPHVYPSVLIDGRGPNTAQVASVATSQAEALSIVRRAKADGFVGIKIYGTFNKSWTWVSARRVHCADRPDARGLSPKFCQTK